MSTPTEDDLETIPDGELLALPSGAIPPGWLSEFFGRRAALVHQQDTDELALELSGDSTRHLMIFPGMDPKEKRRREEEARRSALLADQEMLEYRVVSEVPSVCDRDVPWETPSERPSFQPLEPPVLRESDQLLLSFFCKFALPKPGTKSSGAGVHDRPSL